MTGTITADTDEVREFVETYVAQARAATKDMREPGLLQMILVHPAGDDISGVYRYALNDTKLVQRMTAEAINASEAGHNVYCEGRTVKPGLKGKQRGGLDDTAAVFALTIDSDADKGAAWTPTVPISLAVETSPNNAHFWLFLERAVDAKTGQTLGERLRAITSADSDTGNICQPYRVAGTVNYPNKKKIERRRTITPTRSLGFNPDTLWTPERFEQEFPATVRKPNGSGGTAPEPGEVNIPTDTMLVIRDGVEDADRSHAFWNVITVLRHDGYTVAGIVALLERFPNGIASKYRGRLQREVERIWGKLEGGQQQERQTKPARFRLKAFSEIMLSTALNYLVKGILPAIGLVVVWGPPKCGKSFWTFDVVMHVAIGRTYRGRKVQQGTVVYLALEGGSGFAGRVTAWRKRHLADRPQPVPFYLLDVPVDLVADHKALIDDIRAQVVGSPAVVVIDTLNRAIAGDENKSDDMAKFIRAADAIRMAFGCLVIIVHHCGVVGTRPRGHTSLSGADDAQIAVERDKDGNIVAKVEHMKDAEAGTVIASKLEKVELGTDDDGDPQSSCIIVPAEGGAAGAKLSKVNRFAFELLVKLIKSEKDSVPAPAEAGLSCRVCRMETWRERFYLEYPADKQNTKKKAFLRATLELGPSEEGLVDFWREYVWVRDKNSGTF
jgi:hypothetical protein